MQTVWQRVEECWPAGGEAQVSEYRVWRTKAAELLAGCSIDTVGFSHYGVIVSNVEEALRTVAAALQPPLPEVTAAWVEAYQVQVARFALEGTELEFIAPQGASFFADYKRLFGDGLHHVSFQVRDVASALNTLAANGEQLLDSEPRAGSHGKVAFAAPAILRPLHLEVFQDHF